jgi:3-oxoacyl-[acyl-carrier protein] reductase
MRFQGRSVLVTGGGSGIGRAIAARFAAEGARVVVNDIRAEAAEATVKTIGGEARAVVADVADSGRVRAMFEEIARVVGGLDVLVNNAGIGEVNAAGREAFAAKIETRGDITQNLSDEDWARMLAVHLNGTFYCTREALKLMSRVNRGAIVNISSVAGLMGIEVAPHYGAAKAGILGFTRSVAREVASRGIRVNAICPGFVDTPILDPMPPVTRIIAERQTPLGRIGKPEEIAAAAAFLASDEAGFITGQWLSPNGGLLTV